MSAKSKNQPGRWKKPDLEQYIKAGLTVTQAKKARRAKARLPVILKKAEDDKKV